MAQSTKQNGHLVPSNSTVTTWTTPFVMTERKPFLANRIFNTFDELITFVNNTSAAGEGTDAIDGLTLSVVNNITDTSKNGLYYVVQASGDGHGANKYIIQRVVTSNFTGGTGSGFDNNVQVNSMVSEGSYIVSDNKDISNSDNPQNGMKVITGIYTTSDGKISYSYSYVYDPHNDHSSTGTTGTKVTFGQTDGSSTKVITNVKLNNNGSLSYTYIDLEYDKDHHGSTGTTGTKVTFGQTDGSSTKVITNLKMNTNGSLSYTYIDLEYDKDHHSGSKTSNSNTTLTGDNVGVISSVSLSSDGVLSGTSKTLTHGNAGGNVGTYGLDATKSYTLDNAKFFVPEFTVNAHGHVTAASEKTVTITHPTTYTAKDSSINGGSPILPADGTTVNITVPNITSNTYGHVTNVTRQTYTFKHGDSGVTAGTYGSTASTISHGGTFNIPRFRVNTQGHIVSASNQTITLPNLSVNTSLFTGNNGVTYMLTISNGAIKIDQPIKRIYSTPNPTPSSPNTTITYPSNNTDNYIGSSYTIASPFGYTGIGNETITIEFNGDAPTDAKVFITESNYTYTHNTDFTYSVSGSNINVTLNSGKVRSLIRTVPTTNSGTFGFANVSPSTSVKSKTLSVVVNIGGNDINLSTTLDAKSASRTITPICKYYIMLSGSIVSSPDVSYNGRPSKISVNGGSDLKFIFPERWGTPKFYQMKAEILDWKHTGTQSISTKAYNGTTNKVNYKVYSFGTTKQGDWDITWSAW